jgi:hypothetical protein
MKNVDSIYLAQVRDKLQAFVKKKGDRISDFVTCGIAWLFQELFTSPEGPCFSYLFD